MPETPEIPEELLLAEEVVAESVPEGDAATSAEVCGGTPTSQKRDLGHPAPEGEVEEIGATEDFAESAKENDPMLDVEMLDVHVPHAKHTWKDFIIHIGTITVGLLIAIGLEQSVEKLHQLHQRHELEAALRAEGENNKSLSEANFQALTLDDMAPGLAPGHPDDAGDRGKGESAVSGAAPSPGDGQWQTIPDSQLCRPLDRCVGHRRGR